jgi:hypothetical protein
MTTPMFATIRKYNGAPTLTDELYKRQEEIKAVLQPVQGFHSYYVVKTVDGAVTMTVCDDRAGAEESNRVAAAWLKDKLPTFATRPPEITAGEVRFHLNKNQPALVTV